MSVTGGVLICARRLRSVSRAVFPGGSVAGAWSRARRRRSDCIHVYYAGPPARRPITLVQQRRITVVAASCDTVLRMKSLYLA